MIAGEDFPIPFRQPHGLQFPFKFQLTQLGETKSGEPKRVLPLGDRADSLIDTLPVEERIRSLQLMSSEMDETRYPGFSLPRADYGAYAAYTRSAMYVEVGILRLLYRFAFNKLDSSELHIETAADMVAYLKESFANEHNYSLDSLTADLIMEWYALVPGKYTFLMLWSSRVHDGERVPDTHLVRIDHSLWQSEIVFSRFKRLLLRGYESL